MVVAQLEEQSLPLPEVRGSNLVDPRLNELWIDQTPTADWLLILFNPKFVLIAFGQDIMKQLFNS